MSESQGLMCCGIAELTNIRDDDSPEESLMEVEPNDQGLVIFSDTNVHGYEYGTALVAKIKKCRLGAIIAVPATHNPNTDNKVRMWVWKVNRRALKAWQDKMRKAEPDRWREAYNPYSYYPY